MEEPSEYEVGEILEPIEQQTILFYGKPLRVVRLPNGEPGVVLNELCENMGLERRAQLRRIHRKKAIEAGFASARIDTPGGSQVVSILTLKVTPAWLFGIDANRAKPDMQPEIERYQAECVDVLYRWASMPRLEAPSNLVPVEPITKPVPPGQGAAITEWKAYHEQMAAFLDWQLTIEDWRGSVEGRLESIEALIPDILDRLPDPTITPAHQNMVKYYISQTSKAMGKSPATMYSALYTAFNVPRYTELREEEWDQIEKWFLKQLGRQK